MEDEHGRDICPRRRVLGRMEASWSVVGERVPVLDRAAASTGGGRADAAVFAAEGGSVA